jgi:hypothetical protein
MEGVVAGEGPIEFHGPQLIENVPCRLGVVTVFVPFGKPLYDIFQADPGIGPEL